MPAIEHLPYSVNLWSEDELSIVEVLATASSRALADAAYEAACQAIPDRAISLLGPGVCQTRKAPARARAFAKAVPPYPSRDQRQRLRA